MEYAFYFITLGFGGALLLYAGIVAASGFDAIPRNNTVKVKDKQAYARKFAKILALLALPLVVGGLVGLWKIWVGGIVIAVGLALVLTNINKLTKIKKELNTGYDEPDPDEPKIY